MRDLLVVLSFGLVASGCSLLLDFGVEQEEDAAPSGDAPPDAFIIPPALCMANEPNNDAMTAAAVAFPIEAAVCAGDVGDFYVFDIATDNAAVTIDLTFLHLGGSGDLLLRLLDPNGNEVAVADTESDNEAISTTTQLAGAYVIEVSPSPRRSTAETTYTLQATAM